MWRLLCWGKIKMNKKIPLRLKCKKCGYEWVRRTENLPKRCPNCQTKYWKKE